MTISIVESTTTVIDTIFWGCCAKQLPHLIPITGGHSLGTIVIHRIPFSINYKAFSDWMRLRWGVDVTISTSFNWRTPCIHWKNMNDSGPKWATPGSQCAEGKPLTQNPSRTQEIAAINVVVLTSTVTVSTSRLTPQVWDINTLCQAEPL